MNRGKGHCEGGRRALGAALVGAVVTAGCSGHRAVEVRSAVVATTSTITAAPAPSRTETVGRINESCRSFRRGDERIDPAPATLEARHHVARDRLRLVDEALAELDRAPFARELDDLRSQARAQLRDAGALYQRALTEADPQPLLKQAQSLVSHVASDFYQAGAQDCVAGPSRAVPLPASADAGELLPRQPTAVVSVGPLGADDNRIVADGRMVWVGLKNLGQMVRVDPSTNAVVAHVDLGKAPSGMPQIVDGYLWISTVDEVLRIDPATNRIDRRVNRSALGFGDGQVVVTSESILSCAGHDLVTVAATDGRETARATLPDGCQNVEVDGERTWVLGQDDQLRRVDPSDGRAFSGAVPAHGGFQSIQATDGRIWAFGDGEVEQLDSETGRVLGRAKRSNIDFIQPCAGSGALWLASEPEQRVMRVDARTMSVSELAGGQGANAIACAPGVIWVANSNESTVWRYDVSDLG